MRFFMSKQEKEEQKKKAQEAAEAAKKDAEWNAKYTAKTKKKEVLKIIEEISAKESSLIKSAADAKSKGYMDVYRNTLSFIKIARARKIQAEKFLFQVEAMETMKSIADSSTNLLNSMSAIANTLGAFTLDKNAMMDVQKNFSKTQEQLEHQNELLDEFTSALELGIDGVDMSDVDNPAISEKGIEDEINEIIKGSGVDFSQYEKYTTN